MKKDIGLSVIKNNNLVFIEATIQRENFPKIIIDTENHVIKHINKFFKEIIIYSFIKGKYPKLRMDDYECLVDFTDDEIKELIKSLIDNINKRTDEQIKSFEEEETF